MEMSADDIQGRFRDPRSRAQHDSSCGGTNKRMPRSKEDDMFDNRRARQANFRFRLLPSVFPSVELRGPLRVRRVVEFCDTDGCEKPQ